MNFDLMNPPNQVSRAGFVLTGGKSSRMGKDKAFLDFGGCTLLERALALLREVCPTVVIVGDPDAFAKYGTVIPDIFSGCGPLSGIHAALDHSSADLNLVLAVDMPFVTSQLLTHIVEAAEESPAIVTVPRSASGFQPLCAVYRRPFAAVAERALRAGKYKIDAAFAGLDVRVMEEAELTAAGFSEQSFMNLNSPDDLRAARTGPLQP